MQVFAYIDVDHPAVAWALIRGLFVSADFAPGPSRAYASFMFAGLVQSQNNTRLNNETIIEYVRDKSFPNQISRLRGMYFFDNRELAQRPIDEKWGGHFRAKNLIEFELPPTTSLTRVDANWITEAPLQSDGRLDTSDITWTTRYWAGEPKHKDPTWETIVNGRALVRDMAVRKKAYADVKSRFPRSEVFMEMARLAGEVGSDGGLVTPFLQRAGQNTLRLAYCMYDKDFHDEAVIKKIAAHPDAKNLHRLMSENEIFDTPDLRPWSQDFSLGLQGIFDVASPILSVHHNSV